MAEKIPTLDERLAQLEKDVDDFHSHANRGVREIVVGDLIKGIRKEHQSDRIPDQYIAPDYRAKIEAQACTRYDAETREDDKAIRARLPELRAAVMAQIVEARRLK